MAQVQYLLPAASHVPAAEEEFLNSLPSATYYVPPPALSVDTGRKHVPTEDKVARASSLPTPPPDNFEASEFPSSLLFLTIPGLPYLFSGPPDQLMRERILQATFEADMNEGETDKAFFLADLGKVYKQFTRWRRCLPEVEPFYGECQPRHFLIHRFRRLIDRSAVKCNPDPFVLRLLASLGTGFDCASQAEIQQVLDIAVDPSRIIFANPCKPLSFIRKACKTGVDTMTFDNTDELYKIARSHRGARLVVRILTDDSKSLCRLGLKFGAPLATVPRLLATARELGLDVVGVSFHVGSGCYDANAFDNAVSLASEAFRMGIAAGYRFTLLDVGGGFESHNFEQSADVLNRAIQTYFPRAKQQGVKIIAEPGRYFVSEAFQLAVNVIARRASTPAAVNDSIGDIEVDSTFTAPATCEDKGHKAEPSVMCKSIVQLYRECRQVTDLRV